MKKRELRMLSLLLSLLLALSIFVGCAPEPADEDETKETESQSLTESETTKEEETTSATKTFEDMSDTEKAFYLWNDISILETKTSYQSDMTVLFKGTTQGLPFTMTGTETAKIILSENETFYSDSAEETIDLGEGRYVRELVMKKGYANGKFYTYQSEDGEEKGVYSSVSTEDWKAYFLEAMEEEDLILSSLLVKNVSFEETSNGYEAAFSGFTSKGLLEVENKLLGGTSSVIGKSPTDAELTLQVGKDMLPQKATIQYVYEYEVGENVPAMSIEVVYSHYDEVSASSVDLTGYRQVTHLFEAERIEDDLGKLDIAKTASFDYSEQFIQTLNEETLDDSAATYRVSYSNNEDGYSFMVDADDGDDYLYADGQLKQLQNGSATTTPLDELQARSIIEGYYDPESFGVLDAESVTVTKTATSTKVSITLAEVDLSKFEAAFDAYGFTVEDLEWVEGTYIVELKNGKIARIQYIVEFGLQVRDMGALSFEYIQTVTNLTYTEA